jgi:RNA polymerase sigma-70 factor (ECF subfamily)
VQEIANAFLTSKDAIEKRLYRAKQTIRSENIALEIPASTNLSERLQPVMHILYLLFNEGYHSSHPDHIIRRDLCEEAMRLGTLLTDMPATNVPVVQALLALMCFQASRFDARLNETGIVALLPEQDRSKWNYTLIGIGSKYLSLAATGPEITKYHIEAAIAGTYAKSPDYASVDWQQLLDLYNLLTHYNNSPVVYLNRAIILAKVAGYQQGIESLLAIQGLDNHYLYHSILGEFYLQMGQATQATYSFQTALTLTRSATEIKLLQHKLTLSLSAQRTQELAQTQSRFSNDLS